MHTQLFSQIFNIQNISIILSRIDIPLAVRFLHYMNVIHDQRCFLGIVFVAIIPMTPTPTKKPTAHP